MKRIGLTGGISCGKSSVAKILCSMGVFVLDADQVARDIVQKGQPALDELVLEFGDGILDEEGFLNRKALGAIVMENPQSRQKLNTITHPKIRIAIDKQLNEWESLGAHVAVVEAALMVETKSYLLYDALIVVTCQPDIQIERLMERERFDKETAQKWIESQLPLAQKEAVADALIDNSFDRKTLEHTVQKKWNELLNSLR